MGVDLQSPQDISELLTSELRPHFMRQGVEFECHIVNCVRDVSAMIPKVLRLEGCYRTRNEVESPHSFVFVPRGWLSATLQGAVQQDHPFKHCNHRLDVVVLVRQWMADASLIQAPTLVYPNELRRDSVQFIHTLNTNPDLQMPALKDERKQELESLASFLRSKYGNLHVKAADYYGELIGQSSVDAIAVVQKPARLEFLVCPRNFVTLRPEIRDVQVPSELVHHNLKVVYQRGLRAILDNR